MLARTGHPEDAAKSFESLLASNEQRAALEARGEKLEALSAELGWAMVDAGKTAEADQVFRRLLELQPQGPYAIDARFNLAESASQAQNYAEVVRLLSPLVAAAPALRQETKSGSTAVAKNEGAGEKPAAKGAEGAQGKPSQPSRGGLMPLVLYRLGRSQIELGKWADAEATLDRLIRDDPQGSRNREARLLRAEAALGRITRRLPSRSSRLSRVNPRVPPTR